MSEQLPSNKARTDWDRDWFRDLIWAAAWTVLSQTSLPSTLWQFLEKVSVQIILGSSDVLRLPVWAAWSRTHWWLASRGTGGRPEQTRSRVTWEFCSKSQSNTSELSTEPVLSLSQGAEVQLLSVTVMLLTLSLGWWCWGWTRDWTCPISSRLKVRIKFPSPSESQQKKIN